MSGDWIPTRDECLDMLTAENFPEIRIDDRILQPMKRETIEHSIEVETLAMKYGRDIKRLGWTINLGVLDAGALLHDIGKRLIDKDRPGSDGYGAHNDLGRRLLEARGVHPDVIHVVESHSAMPAEWIRKLRKVDIYNITLEDRDYMPRTLEAEVVCYVDKLTDGSKYVTLAEWMAEHNRDAPGSRKVRSKEYFESFQRDFMIALHEKFMIMTEVPYEEYVKYEKSGMHQTHGRHKRTL